jgi:hypothetical protein
VPSNRPNAPCGHNLSKIGVLAASSDPAASIVEFEQACSLRVLSARAMQGLRCDLFHSACVCGHAGVRTKCRLCVEVNHSTSPAGRTPRSRR